MSPSQTQNIALHAAPSTLGFYWRAITVRKSRVAPAEASELATVSLVGVRPHRLKVAAYRKICGFRPGRNLPATYPFVLSTPLHAELLVSRAFPFPVWGLVHVRNEIIQHRHIADSERLDLHCTLSGPRKAAAGLEFDLLTQALSDGDRVWECVTTVLRREPGRKGAARAAVPQSPAEPPLFAEFWRLPASIGRFYAAVSGDFNPIHLHPLTAKPLGFKRAIAHGMWTKARCMAALEASFDSGALRVSTAFKLPIHIPATVRFERRGSDGGIDFFIKDETGQKPHVVGRCEPLGKARPGRSR